MQPTANPQPAAPAPPPVAPVVPQAPPAPMPQPQQPPTVNPQTGFFGGRLNRVGYLMALVLSLSFLVVPIILQLLVRATNRTSAIVNLIAILFGFVGVLMIIPLTLSASIRRWHDLDQTGWFVGLSLLPFVGFIVLIIYLFVPGTKGPNKYGEPDTKPARPRKVLLNK